MNEIEAKQETPWHQVSPYAGVKHDPNELIIENGQVYSGVNKTLTREAIDQVKAGVRCIRCEEPQINGAWPKACSLCGFPIKKEQMNLFQKWFKGEEWVGTTINFRDELDRLDDELERDNFAERSMGGVLIPRGVNI